MWRHMKGGGYYSCGITYDIGEGGVKNRRNLCDVIHGNIF